MFTGIIEAVAEVRARPSDLLKLRLPLAFKGISIGESVAVDGVCLTADRRAGQELAFRLLPETLRATTLGSLKAGDRVNLERSMRAGSRLGGHLLLGHVDGKGKVVSRNRERDSLTLGVSLPRGLASWLVPKGPIALDGVSLTLGPRLGRHRFTVHLVAHTLAATTLAAKGVGAALNLEIDPVAKYLRGML